MTEQPDDAPRRVVKKVVKKTVVRPVSPLPGATASPNVGSATASTASTAAPAHPVARLATPARVHAARSATPAAAPAAAPTQPAPVQSVAPPMAAVAAAAPMAPAAPALVRPVQPVAPAVGTAPAVIATVQLDEPAARTRRLHLPKPDLRGRASDVRHGIGDRVSDGALAVRHRIEDAWDWLIGLRLPQLSPVRGAVITGIIVGLVSVGIGLGFYRLFSATLGTQAGGGWGLLAFVFLSFVAYGVGELLLAGFGVPHGRVVSVLSVLLVLFAVLAFFINVAAGVWAWVLIPVLAALAFAGSSALMAVISQEENAQRLPWEPTDESQVNLD